MITRHDRDRIEKIRRHIEIEISNERSCTPLDDLRWAVDMLEECEDEMTAMVNFIRRVHLQQKG